VYEVALALLHPFMPFITEEIWQQLPVKKESGSLCVRKYPTEEEGLKNSAAEEEMAVVMDVVTGIRSIRGELNISPSLELTALIRPLDHAEDVLRANMSYVMKLARAKEIQIGSDILSPKNAATAIKPAMEIYVPLKGLIDIDAEVKRLKKEFAKTEKDLIFVKKKLANEEFRSKAPKSVVEECQVKYNENKDKLEGIQENINKLQQWGESSEE
jgi:valyl-tRNA synthetase